MSAAQAEVDRLLEILKDGENDKLEKEAIIKDLQEYVHPTIRMVLICLSLTCS
ncbi:hypothetical protein DPMN_004841 [Dreissena polymorpha]|uniref:Uncharacterized protein n=1 Tax=Dreissena polymorpha TaxID=45954 RepID=A0A9D4RTW8_DREPO|nr:hypothetical protein DPMN_004841 [Dreissena polymorpha]